MPLFIIYTAGHGLSGTTVGGLGHPTIIFLFYRILVFALEVPGLNVPMCILSASYIKNYIKIGPAVVP